MTLPAAQWRGGPNRFERGNAFAFLFQSPEVADHENGQDCHEGTSETIEFFDEESVTFEYPSDSLPGLVSYYEAWFATQGVDLGPTFGSSPSRFWDVMVDGERVKFELYVIEGTDRARLSILCFE